MGHMSNYLMRNYQLLVCSQILNLGVESWTLVNIKSSFSKEQGHATQLQFLTQGLEKL